MAPAAAIGSGGQPSDDAGAAAIILRSVPLYDEECQGLLRQALCLAASSASTASSSSSTAAVTPSGPRSVGAAAAAAATAGMAGRSAGGSPCSGDDGNDDEPHSGGVRNGIIVAGPVKRKPLERTKKEEEKEDANGDGISRLAFHTSSSSSSSSSSYDSSSSESVDSEQDEDGAEDDFPAPPASMSLASAPLSPSASAAFVDVGSRRSGAGSSRGNPKSKKNGTKQGRKLHGRTRSRYAESVPCRPLLLPPDSLTAGVEQLDPRQQPQQQQTALLLFVPACLWMSSKQRQKKRQNETKTGDDDDDDERPAWMVLREDNGDVSDKILVKEILDLATTFSLSPPPPPPNGSTGAARGGGGAGGKGFQGGGGGGGPYAILWWMRSGRFAGGVFHKVTCVAHSTSTRYTTRRGQGKAQSAKDNSKSKAKSVGAQLRRAGEIQLWEDVRKVALAWKFFFDNAAIVFAWAPPVMQSTLLDQTFAGIVDRDDVRIRTHLPVSAGRPSHESLVALYKVVTTCTVRPFDMAVVKKGASAVAAATTEPQAKTVTYNHGTRVQDQKKEGPVDAVPIPNFPRLTSLHRAAAAARVEEVAALLERFGLSLSAEEGIIAPKSRDDDAAVMLELNAPAGPLHQTPLHYAAAAAGASATATATALTEASEASAAGISTGIGTVDAGSVVGAGSADAAAACVYKLLVDGKADPTLVDARQRVPYYLAENDKVRAAFRRARAVLGETCWDWEAARVGPPLNGEDEALKREREAEKRRQKKQRQKERKAKERAAAEAAAQDLQKQQEEARRQEEAKRIRDGLRIKPQANRQTNTCDFCQKVCVGQRRRDMYQRLDYAYCSTQCVQQHKRELMAAAALARFKGGGDSNS